VVAETRERTTREEARNERRRDRYRSDPTYRENLLRQQADYRQRRPKARRHGAFRVVNGVEVTVHYIGEVAEACDRKVITIRLWERQGLIPVPSIPGSKRVYLPHQIALVRKLAEFFDTNRTARGSDDYRARLKKLREHISKHWS
jgi:hypothetical protein